MVDFKKIFETLLESVKKIASEEFTEYRVEASEDVRDFLHECKDDLERWVTQLASGELSADDFEWLIKSKKEVLKLTLLKQKGLAQVKLDRFKDKLLQEIKKSILDVLSFS